MALSANTTAALETADGRIRAAIHEFQVFNIAIISLALCILTVTAVLCGVSFHNRRRQTKRARVYESTVAGDPPDKPADITGVRRGRSFRNPLALFRRQDGPKDNARIYYIYSNPLPVGHEEDSAPSDWQGEVSIISPTLLSLEDYAKDLHSGVVLEPPTFYMQL